MPGYFGGNILRAQLTPRCSSQQEKFFAEGPKKYKVEVAGQNIDVLSVTFSGTPNATFEQYLYDKMKQSGCVLPVYYHATDLRFDQRHCFKEFASLLTKITISQTDFNTLPYPFFAIGARNLEQLEFKYCTGVSLKSVYFQETKLTQITFCDSTMDEFGSDMALLADENNINISFHLGNERTDMLSLLQHHPALGSLRILSRKRAMTLTAKQRVEVDNSIEQFGRLGIGSNNTPQNRNCFPDIHRARH